MGRVDIADVGREANLKMYIWEVESMVVGGGVKEGVMVEVVFLKREPDHEDGLM